MNKCSGVGLYRPADGNMCSMSVVYYACCYGNMKKNKLKSVGICGHVDA